MAKGDRPSAYPDCKIVLDKALALGGGTYMAASHGAAVSFRQRCYKFRKAYYEVFHDAKYDALTFPRIPPESNEVVITRHAVGLFIPNDSPASDYDDIAADLAKKLNGDIL